MERCLKYMASRSILPYWLCRLHDRNIWNDAVEAAHGFADPGNYILDVMVHAFRLWQYCEATRVPMVIRQSIHEYGHKTNTSSQGPVKLSGNIVEAMSKNLQSEGSKAAAVWKDYDPVAYWVEGKTEEEGKWRGHDYHADWQWHRNWEKGQALVGAAVAPGSRRKDGDATWYPRAEEPSYTI